MHEAVFCSDLLGLICQNCDLHTLTQLSLTSRTISDEALHVLWSSIENFGPLIRCMPADLWKESPSTPSTDRFLVRFLSTSPTQKCRLTLFSGFADQYGIQITSGFSSEQLMSGHLEVFRGLSDIKSKHTLFWLFAPPRARISSCCPKSEGSYSQTRTYHPLSTTFLPQSLKSTSTRITSHYFPYYQH